MSAIPVKACSRCGVSKPRDEFNFLRIARSVDGLSYHCRSCHQGYRRKWRASDSARSSRASNDANERRRVEPLHEAARSLVRGISERIRLKGYEFHPQLLQWAFIRDWLRSQPQCECCGTKFDMGPKDGVRTDDTPSVDRFDNDKGYTLDNAALICWRCNNLKRNYSEQDLRRVADWMEKRRKHGFVHAVLARMAWKVES